MILFDSQNRIPVAVKGRMLRFQQDVDRFLGDSMYYFDLSTRELEILVVEAGADSRVGAAYFS